MEGRSLAPHMLCKVLIPNSHIDYLSDVNKLAMESIVRLEYHKLRCISKSWTNVCWGHKILKFTPHIMPPAAKRIAHRLATLESNTSLDILRYHGKT